MVTTDSICENKRGIRGRKEVGEGKGDGRGEGKQHSMRKMSYNLDLGRCEGICWGWNMGWRELQVGESNRKGNWRPLGSEGRGIAWPLKRGWVLLACTEQKTLGAFSALGQTWSAVQNVMKGRKAGGQRTVARRKERGAISIRDCFSSLASGSPAWP